MIYWIGATLRYFLIGIFLTIIGLINLFSNQENLLLLGVFIIVTLAGVFLTLSIQGIQFNPLECKMRKFYYILFLKIGKQIEYDEDSVLVYAMDSSEIKGMKSYRSHSGSTGTKTHIIFLREIGGKRIEVDQFTDSRKGARELRELAKMLALPFEDKIMEAKKASLNRRNK